MNDGTVSLIELATRTGVAKHRLLNLLKTGGLQGDRNPGRTGHWMIPLDQIPIAAALRVRPGNGQAKTPRTPHRYKKVTAADVGLSDEWVTYSEAARITGAHKDTIRQQVVRGELDSTTGTLGRRTFHFVRRDELSNKVHKKHQGRLPMITRDMVDTALLPSFRSAAGEAELHNGPRKLTLREAALYKGVATSTIHRRIKIGSLKAESVQVGKNSFVTYVSTADLDNLQVEPRSRRGKWDRKAKRAQHVDAVIAPKAIEVLSNTLNEKLLELAALVRTGGYIVESLDVSVRVKS